MIALREPTELEEPINRRRWSNFVVTAIALAMFVYTGVQVLPQVVHYWLALAPRPDLILSTALVLNIALLMFGWTRYRDVIKELANRMMTEEAARLLAQIDPLTQCWNRRAINSQIDGLVASASLTNGQVVVLLIDLDNFKQINDRNGHRCGDAVLLAVADRIRSLLPPEGLIARLGGDEFACALTFLDGDDALIDRFADNLVQRLTLPVSFENTEVQITVSGGLATNARLSAAHAGDITETLLHQADIAMYEAKKRGKNQFSWFDPPMEQQLKRRNDLEVGFRNGLINGEFVPYYEQQIDLATGRITGFEMLARWFSPKFGNVMPDTFIPMAEEMGLIADLSEVLLAQAFRDAARWDPSLTLAVNISPLQFRDPWFAQKILKLLVLHNFPASRLDIELTESCLSHDPGEVRQIMTSLRNQGVTFSIDDFGTGYSGLSQLGSLPFDQIKIDRSFVANVLHDAASRSIVDTIVQMSSKLDFGIVAEGIESHEVLELLQSCGGVFLNLRGQGHLFGKPECASDVERRLASFGSTQSQPASNLRTVAPDVALNRLSATG